MAEGWAAPLSSVRPQISPLILDNRFPSQKGFNGVLVRKCPCGMTADERWRKDHYVLLCTFNLGAVGCTRGGGGEHVGEGRWVVSSLHALIYSSSLLFSAYSFLRERVFVCLCMICNERVSLIMKGLF